MCVCLCRLGNILCSKSIDFIFEYSKFRVFFVMVSVVSTEHYWFLLMTTFNGWNSKYTSDVHKNPYTILNKVCLVDLKNFWIFVNVDLNPLSCFVQVGLCTLTGNPITATYTIRVTVCNYRVLQLQGCAQWDVSSSHLSCSFPAVHRLSIIPSSFCRSRECCCFVEAADGWGLPCLISLIGRWG